MSDEGFRQLHDQIAALDGVDWIDDSTREMVERFIPDLVHKLPDRTAETLDQVFGRKRAAAVRKTPPFPTRPKH